MSDRDGFTPTAGGAGTVGNHQDYVLTMYGSKDVVHMRLRAVNAEAIIAMVEGRRVPTPPGMTAYVVSKVQ